MLNRIIIISIYIYISSFVNLIAQNYPSYITIINGTKSKKDYKFYINPGSLNTKSYKLGERFDITQSMKDDVNPLDSTISLDFEIMYNGDDEFFLLTKSEYDSIIKVNRKDYVKPIKYNSSWIKSRPNQFKTKKKKIYLKFEVCSKEHDELFKYYIDTSGLIYAIFGDKIRIDGRKKLKYCIEKVGENEILIKDKELIQFLTNKNGDFLVTKSSVGYGLIHKSTPEKYFINERFDSIIILPFSSIVDYSLLKLQTENNFLLYSDKCDYLKYQYNSVKNLTDTCFILKLKNSRKYNLIKVILDSNIRKRYGFNNYNLIAKGIDSCMFILDNARKFVIKKNDSYKLISLRDKIDKFSSITNKQIAVLNEGIKIKDLYIFSCKIEDKWAALISSKNDTGITYVKNFNDEIIVYDSIAFYPNINNNVFLKVKDDYYWGVIKKDGNILVKINYKDVVDLNKDAYKVYRDNLWFLKFYVNNKAQLKKSRKLLEKGFNNIIEYYIIKEHDFSQVVTDDNNFRIVNRKGRSVFTQQDSINLDIIKGSRLSMIHIDSNSSSLIDITRKRKLDIKNYSFFDMIKTNNSYIYVVKLVDTLIFYNNNLKRSFALNLNKLDSFNYNNEQKLKQFNFTQSGLFKNKLRMKYNLKKHPKHVNMRLDRKSNKLKRYRIIN